MKPISPFCLIPIVLVLSVFPTAGQTNSIDALKSSHELALLEVGAACVQREKDALKQYGKALDSLLAALKEKGDLDAYVAVEAEKKRLAAEGTVPEAKDAVPVLADAAGACWKAVAAAATDRARQTAALLKKHVAALDGIIRQLMKAGKIDEAKAVKVDRDRAAAELADLVSKLPSEAKPSDSGEAMSPGKTKSLPESLKKGLVLYYSFDGTLGRTVADKSGKGHEGKVQGAKWAPRGKVGGAYEFNGKGDCISVPNGPQFDFGTSDFTMSAWICPKEDAQNAIVCKSTANDQGYFFTQADKDGIQFLSGAGGDWSVNTHSSSGLTLNAWNHVVVSQISGQIVFWINGVSRGGGRGGTVNGDATSLLIGGSSWGDLNFKGLIDEVMIFDRALTDKEVKQLHDAQK